jgi:hypothetical protein
MLSCENSVTNNDSVCDEKLVLDDAMYQNGIYDEFVFDSVWIEGNCLKANVIYGGGCGDVLFQLLWNGAIMESNPPLVQLKLSFVDNDLCKALIHKTLSYDISMLQVGGSGRKVFVHLKDWKKQLIYTY